MPKLQRKSAKLFANGANAGIGGISQFGSLAEGNINYSKDPDVIQATDAYDKGWSAAVVGNKSPAMEDRNALDYLLSYQQAYIMQRGIPEWLATETYYQGSFASKSNGSLYVSKVDNNTGNDPGLDNTETYWMKFPTPAEVASRYVQKAGDTMTGALAVQANISSTGTISAGTSMTTVTPAANSNDTTVPTTAWVRTFLGSVNMLGRMNYNAAVDVSVSRNSSYTVPSKGYIVIYDMYVYSGGTITLKVNGHTVCSKSTSTSYFQFGLLPVSQGDVLTAASSDNQNSSARVIFAPQY